MQHNDREIGKRAKHLCFSSAIETEQESGVLVGETARKKNWPNLKSSASFSSQNTSKGQVRDTENSENSDSVASLKSELKFQIHIAILGCRNRRRAIKKRFWQKQEKREQRGNAEVHDMYKTEQQFRSRATLLSAQESHGLKSWKILV
jgi:hypothetical protein